MTDKPKRPEFKLHKKPEPKQNNPDVAVAEFNRKWKEEWRKTLQPTPWAIRLD